VRTYRIYCYFTIYYVSKLPIGLMIHTERLFHSTHTWSFGTHQTVISRRGWCTFRPFLICYSGVLATNLCSVCVCVCVCHNRAGLACLACRVGYTFCRCVLFICIFKHIVYCIFVCFCVFLWSRRQRNRRSLAADISEWGRRNGTEFCR